MELKIGDKVRILETDGCQLHGSEKELNRNYIGKVGSIYDIDDAYGRTLIFVKLDDLTCGVFYAEHLKLVNEQNITTTPTSFNLVSPNFEMSIYRDEFYLKPYFIDSMEFSISYDDIDELIEVLQTTKETRDKIK